MVSKRDCVPFCDRYRGPNRNYRAVDAFYKTVTREKIRLMIEPNPSHFQKVEENSMRTVRCIAVFVSLLFAVAVVHVGDAGADLQVEKEVVIAPKSGRAAPTSGP